MNPPTRKFQFVARARFPCQSADPAARAAFREEVLGLFAQLRKQGRVLGGEVAGYVGGALELSFEVALPDSLDARHFRGKLRADWDELLARCATPPTLSVVDDDAGGQTLDWREQGSLYLFTHAFDEASPVCGGADGVPIPLYLLPIEPREMERIHFWQLEYRDLDRVQLASGALELAAYAQLADPRSALCDQGRALCGLLARATALPTYLYLHRYYGREGERERTRVCPGCGGAWARVASAGRGLAWFDFRCEHCCLVSHAAPQHEPGEEHAEIGEWPADASDES